MNNISVPNRLKKRCYNKGVSLFNERTLEPKNIERVVKNCSNDTKINGNSVMYGVPPRPERARAVRKERPTLTVNEALAIAEPFYSFKNPMYLPSSPVPGNRNSLYYTIGHDVWTVVPEYFPGPSTNAKRPAPKRTKLPTAEQVRRKKDDDKKRDERYKKKWASQKPPTKGHGKKHFKK
jgi:hypothetical protein